MAIYRAESSRRVALMIGVGVVVGLVLGAALGRVTAPSLSDQMADIRTQAAPIASSLEVIRAEYPKFLAGGAGGTDPGGAEGAMTKLEATYKAVAPALETVDRTAADALGTSVSKLREAMTARVTEAALALALDDVQADLDKVLGR